LSMHIDNMVAYLEQSLAAWMLGCRLLGVIHRRQGNRDNPPIAGLKGKIHNFSRPPGYGPKNKDIAGFERGVLEGANDPAALIAFVRRLHLSEWKRTDQGKAAGTLQQFIVKQMTAVMNKDRTPCGNRIRGYTGDSVDIVQFFIFYLREQLFIN